ncbi:type III secretion system export apparatus subunit SctV [Roseibium sediminis]|uniref:type III secretion system export apparatus subunit SctV n=1 Tax=Roseibium sediminis TaxID=1775174 RepID=UPI00123D740F|nr:type III secretion system export apparatus subunit SctV [Roseibium sediminis]
MLGSLSRSLSQRQDLVLVALMMMTIVLMILPMPTILLDVLIALNISFTILILTVAIYLKRPDSFSTFPAVILIATAFRLAISISTTRLILSEADAGAVIETFGTFVTQGNVIVGLVIFLIITTVQFLVITKGSERVAEVSARFVLDALPGRQMSIDAELRAGDITPEEAKGRRRALDRENQFYGAMDGAMKFVKGDAIAGLIIIAVNLIGGIGVGMLQYGLSVGDAINLFSRLTIGDGLVAQIPALFMALCAGTVITRVNTDDQSDLGSDMFKQLANSPRTLWVSAVVVGLLGLVPGFPKIIFFALAAGLAFMGLSLSRREKAEVEQQAALVQEAEANAAVVPVEETELAQVDDLATIRVSPALMGSFSRDAFMADRAAALEAYTLNVGLPAPRFGVMEDYALEDRSFEIDLDGVPVFSGYFPPDSILVEADDEVAELAGISTAPVDGSWPFRSPKWAPAHSLSKVQSAGIPARTTEQTLVDLALHYLKDNIGRMLGFRDVQGLINDLNATSPELAEHISQTVSPARMLDILRRLLEEGVPLSSRRVFFEAVAELGGQEQDSALLVEMIRRSMRRQICNNIADRNRVISAYIVEPDLEQALRSSLRHTETGSYLMLSNTTSAMLLQQLQKVAMPSQGNVTEPVIATSTDLRRHLRSYLVEHGLTSKVVSFQEISPEFYLQPIGTLSGAEEPFKMSMSFSN